MRYSFVVLLALLWGTLSPTASAQSGTVTGSVLDGRTGETLIGVNVVVPGGIGGQVLGTTTDLDGRFRLSLPAGTYALAFTYLGYDAQTVEGVSVEPGQTVELSVLLNEASLGLGEVVVQAEALQANTEAALLRLQARAPAIMDGISAQQIRRSPDANSAQALRRVTGVTLFGGKFVYVRGLPERYSGTLLNGVPVPSTEPDRRAFTFDLIPSNLLDNVVVAKAATPDLPGDAAGGVLQIETIDFPEITTASLSLSSGISNATGVSLMTSPGGGTDFLGIDDGSRALPAGLPAGNISSPDFTDEDRAAFGRLFANNWAITPQQGNVTPNVSASAGSATDTPIGRLGAIAAGTYRSGFSLTEMTRREFEGADQLRFDYTGTRAGYNVTWGGIANVSLRPSPQHAISFKNFYSRTADDEVSQLFGSEFTSSGAEQQLTAIRFLSRDVYAGQLIGDHFFAGLGGLQVRWEAGRAFTRRNEPDYSRTVYERPFGSPEGTPFRLTIGQTVSLKTGGRFFSSMDEGAWSGALRGTMPMGQARVTLGGAASTTDRDFASRLLAVTQPRRNFDFTLRELPIDSIFLPQHFGRLDRPGCENGGARCEGFLIGETGNGANDYTAGQDVASAFAMLDTPVTLLTDRLRFVGGLRLESSRQRLNSTTFGGDSLAVRNIETSVLPSVSLTYALAEATNLRLAYGRSINRPELRELAPFPYFDFELQTTVYGNDSLRQTAINSFDLRLETFPGAGQMLSTSLFYKDLGTPIERVVVPGVALNAERTFANAESGRLYGIEFEGRYGLGFVAPYLSRSGVLLNYTRVWSETVTAASAGSLPRVGPLQGQASYVVNAGLNLVEPTYATSLTVLYNRLGARVFEVATAFEDDVIEAGRDVLDVSLIQPFGNGRYELRLTLADAFGQPLRYTQEGELLREDRVGRSFGFGISARF